MRGLADVTLRFASDDDLLSLESKLDSGNGNGIWPRQDKTGKELHPWDRYHQEAMNELARRLRARKGTSEPFELGRLDPRSKDKLRPAAANLALHYLFIDADNAGDLNGFFARKAAHYWERGGSILEAESSQLDYDVDNSGTTDEIEKNQPFPMRFIRG